MAQPLSLSTPTYVDNMRYTALYAFEIETYSLFFPEKNLKFYSIFHGKSVSNVWTAVTPKTPFPNSPSPKFNFKSGFLQSEWPQWWAATRDQGGSRERASPQTGGGTKKNHFYGEKLKNHFYGEKLIFLAKILNFSRLDIFI